MISLDSNQLNQIKRIGEGAYPNECCGVLVGSIQNGTKYVSEVIEAENQRSDSASNRYLIAPDFILELERRLRGTENEILGFFHSHPDVPARPSIYDRDHAWPWYCYVITSVRKGKAEEILAWQLKEDRSDFTPDEWQLQDCGNRGVGS